MKNIEQKVDSQSTLSAADQFFRLLYPGFRVIDFKVNEENKLEFFLEPTSDPICPGCRRPCSKIQGKQKRTARESSFLHGIKQVVYFEIRRVRCDCGCTQNEYLSWLQPNHTVTNMCIGWLQSFLALGVKAKSLTAYTKLSREVINKCDNQLQEHLYGHADMRRLRYLIVDQIVSVDKSSGENQCATVFRDAENKNAVWTALSPEGIYKFEKTLQKMHKTDQIGSICYDVNGPMAHVIEDCFSDIKTLYDPYQLLLRFQTDVISAAQKLSTEKTYPLFDSPASVNVPAVRSVGGYSWNLNRVDHTREDDPKKLLAYVQEDNRLLSWLYPISQMLRQSLEFDEWAQGRAVLHKCRSMLSELADKFVFPPAEYYAGILKKYEKEILHNLVCDYSINRCAEANNKSKITRLIKTMSDKEQVSERTLRQKVRANFPGRDFNAWEKLKPSHSILETRIWEPPLHVKPSK